MSFWTPLAPIDIAIANVVWSNTVICFFGSNGAKAADLENPSWKSRVDHSCGVRRHPRQPPTPLLSLLCVGDLDPTAATKHCLRLSRTGDYGPPSPFFTGENAMSLIWYEAGNIFSFASSV